MSDVIEYPPNCVPIPRSCGTSELVKKLKILSEALQVSDTNDECGQPNRYRSLIMYLADPRFLDNNSKDVQIWLACCLADILRVFAPNVPIGDPSQLKDVLMFIVKTLKGLGSPTNPLFRRYFYLLENLSVVSTLVLCLELPQDDANQVIRMLLKTSMEVANGKEWKLEPRAASEDGSAVDDDGEERNESRDKVIALLIGIISKLLRDIDQVSVEVLDVLFFYLINPQKSNNRESYHMSRQIIQATQTSLEAAIQSLLTQSLLSGGLPHDCDLVGNSRKKLHDIILELHEVAPELVAPVLPQLSSSLRAEDEQQRLLATKLVGKLAASGKARFCDDNPKLWKCYMERFKDSSSEVRETFARDAHEILLRHSQLRGQISSALSSLTRDLDDSVRLTAVLCIIETARKKLVAVNESLIIACCDRMKDKKPKIRQEVIAKLLHLYCKVVMGEEHTASESAAVAIIPKRALALYMLASMTEEKLMIERYFSSYIIPYKMEMTKRVRCMLELFAKLDNFEAQVFAEIVARSAVHRRILREMLDIISRQNASDDKAQLQSKIQRISSTHHDPTGFSIALKHFSNLLSTDQKCFEYAEYLVSNEYTTAKVEEACKDLVARAMDTSTIPKDCQTNIRRYIERVAPFIMDQDSAVELLRLVLRAKGDADCGNLEAASKMTGSLRLLRIWGENFPHIFSRADAVHSILNLIVSDDHKAVEVGLHVLYHVTHQSSLKLKEQSWCDVAVTQVWNVLLSTNENFGRCCKVATRVICRLLGREECTARFRGIYSEMESRVSMDDPPACVNALQVISEFHRDLPQEFGSPVKNLITEVVVPMIILSPLSEDCHDESDGSFKPLEELAVSRYCMPKVYGMKLLARYLYTCSGEGEDDVLATKTFNMFFAFISAAGDLHDADKNISSVEKAWLRAVAGASLLKLCYIQKYSQMIGVDSFATLGTLMIDNEDCVRNYFVKRLNKGISRNRLTVEYLSMFSLAPLVTAGNADEEPVVKTYHDVCRGFLIAAINRRRHLIQAPGFSPMFLPYHQPEYAVAYTIWLLAHQPMLGGHTDIPNMAKLQECLWFVMEAFLSKKESADFEFIYRLLQDVKESNDALFDKRRKNGEIGEAEVTGQSKKMWALADLGMVMLLYRGKISIRHEPRKPLLSIRFFVHDKNSEHARTVYAPHELLEDEKERNGKLPAEEKRRFLNATTNTSMGRRRVIGSKNTTKVRRGHVKEKKRVVNTEDSISSPESTVGAVAAGRTKNRKPLKVEQEHVTAEEKKKDVKNPISSSSVTSPIGLQGKTSRSSSMGSAKPKSGTSPTKVTPKKSLEEKGDVLVRSPNKSSTKNDLSPTKTISKTVMQKANGRTNRSSKTSKAREDAQSTETAATDSVEEEAPTLVRSPRAAQNSKAKADVSPSKMGTRSNQAVEKDKENAPGQRSPKIAEVHDKVSPRKSGKRIVEESVRSTPTRSHSKNGKAKGDAPPMKKGSKKVAEDNQSKASSRSKSKNAQGKGDVSPLKKTMMALVEGSGSSSRSSSKYMNGKGGRSPTKLYAKKEKDRAEPSTSNDPVELTGTRSSRSRFTQQSPKLPNDPSTSKISKKHNSSLKRPPDEKDYSPQKRNNLKKELDQSPVVRRKAATPSINNFPNGIDFSPILASGVKTSLRGRANVDFTVSTSTPMPNTTETPSMNKANTRKRVNQVADLQLSDDDLEQPKAKKHPQPTTLRTRSRRSSPPAGPLSSRSPANSKKQATVNSSPRPKRLGRKRGNAK